MHTIVAPLGGKFQVLAKTDKKMNQSLRDALAEIFDHMEGGFFCKEYNQKRKAKQGQLEIYSELIDHLAFENQILIERIKVLEARLKK